MSQLLFYIWTSMLFGLTVSMSSDPPLEYCQYDSFNATCPAGQVIQLTEALYGRMHLGRCLTQNYGSMGCSHDVIREVDRRCSGRQGCSIAIPDEGLHRLTPCPSGLATFLSASYACVTVVQPGVAACDSSQATLTASSGNIASLVSQRTAYGTDACPWRIEAKPGQRINITLYDFNTVGPSTFNALAASGGNDYCRAYAIVREGDSGKSDTICSSKYRVTEQYMSRTNVVEVRLLNKHSNTKDYFILQYKVVGCPQYVTQPGSWIRYDGDVIIVTCNGTKRSWTMRCQGNQWDGDAMNCSQNIATGWNSHRRPTSVMHLPLELTVVIISSVAFVVVIVVLVVGLLCMKRRRMRNRRPTGNPLLSESDKDPYGFTLVGRCGGPQGSDSARSPMKDKLYASAIEMKCPRHRSAVTVDGGYTNIWETRYPIAINGAGNIESEYGIRLVDNSDKQSYEDPLAGTISAPAASTGTYGTAVQPACHLASQGSLHHHHLHNVDPRIESTKLVKSHSCRRYEDQDVPVYFDGSNMPTDTYGRNLDTGAHIMTPLTQEGDAQNTLPVT